MMDKTPQFIVPHWPAPDGVKVAITTRIGGVSRSPFDSCNLGGHVGDDPQAVAANRAAVSRVLELPQQIQWLEQIHSNKVVEAGDGERVLTADGVYTQQANRVCAVLTADCLPVFLCSANGQQVGVFHAGWRGLAGGILREAVARFENPAQVLAYLGPAIGPTAFEVGIDVLEAFFETAQSPAHADVVAGAFKPGKKPLRFMADLYQLARAELSALGVTAVYGGEYCTYSDSARFYSFRRDGKTGRMASLIWRSH